jgi:hypothetical protein
VSLGTVRLGDGIYPVRSVSLQGGAFVLTFVIPSCDEVTTWEYRLHGEDGSLIYIGHLNDGLGQKRRGDGDWHVTVSVQTSGKRTDNWRAVKAGT